MVDIYYNDVQGKIKIGIYVNKFMSKVEAFFIWLCLQN